MRTSQPISAIRHLIPLALACAAILSTSAMCENDLLDPVAPGPVDPEPTPEVLYAPYTLIVSGGKSVYFDAAERPEAVFEVRCAQEPELAFEAEGCGYTYEKTFGYSESARMNAAAVRVTVEPRDTVWSLTLTASNAKGSSAKTCRGEKARLTYPAKHYDIGLESEKIDLAAQGNFPITETVVDTIGTYWWRNIATGYEQNYIKIEGSVANIAFNRGIHWRTTEPRHMVFVVTAKADNGRFLTDTVTVDQLGDDLSWAWDEIDAYCEICGKEDGRVFSFSNYQELLETVVYSYENIVRLQHEYFEQTIGESYKDYGRREYWTPSDAKDGHVHGISLVEPSDKYFELSPKVGKLKYAEFLWIEGKTGGIKWPLPDEVKELEDMTQLDVWNCGVTARLESQELLKYLATREKNPVKLILHENNFYGPVPDWMSGTKCLFRKNKLEGVVPQRYDIELDNPYTFPYCYQQQDGYEIWKSTDSKPKGYEYHESYYWK